MENQHLQTALLRRAAILDQRNVKDQMLDSMDIERERGITIKVTGNNHTV